VSEFGHQREEVTVTVVIIGGKVEDGKTRARIIKETSKISDFSTLILEAYFNTYCKRIRQHIVVYEIYFLLFLFIFLVFCFFQVVTTYFT
jgi:hypothetical protein